MDKLATYQWVLIVGSSLLFIWFSPKAKTVAQFFKAKVGESQPSIWVLTSSLVISWIFAKSITNAANLGMSFGLLGGIAYGTYYLSFLVAGLIIYKMRTEGGYESIHHFLNSKFGRSAIILFSILIAFRLFNEVWSNTMVIAQYFGTEGSFQYYLAAIVFSILTVFYAMKGGLSSSLFTDVIQIVLFGFLLCIILISILPSIDTTQVLKPVGMNFGLDLLLVAAIQVFSYPFHDPVMTDRAFITDPKTMLKSFFWAVPIGFLAIVLFSFIGIYASQNHLVGDATVALARSSSLVMTLVINFIMITSASSTLDSAFSSFSKLAIIDLKLFNHSITAGRAVMMGMVIIGTTPIFFSPEILSATTISGTMVIGLAPVFLFWKWDMPRWSFTVVVGMGLLIGSLFTLGYWPECLTFWDSKYGDLLSVNILGSLMCLLLFLILKAIKEIAYAES